MPPKLTADVVLNALGDATRRGIVKALSKGPRSVSSMAIDLEITLTAVGQHLQVLQKSGLVHTEKAGRVRTCRLDRTGFSILEKWIEHHRTAWEQQLDRLGELLRRVE